MDKAHILSEIRRTAAQNGDIPFGAARFTRETGISESQWRGRYWARWSDAVLEAGYIPNKYKEAYENEFILDCLETIVLKLDRFPTVAEIKLHRQQDSSLPTANVFQRIGNKSHLASLLSQHTSDARVKQICDEIALASDETETMESKERDGFVYLMKSGRFYKIGFTNSLDRRQYELGIQLPEGIKPIHSIRTDDPSGIEAYWHNRFREKRKNGEWFALNTKDIKAFKKRNYM